MPRNTPNLDRTVSAAWKGLDTFLRLMAGIGIILILVIFVVFWKLTVMWFEQQNSTSSDSGEGVIFARDGR